MNKKIIQNRNYVQNYIMISKIGFWGKTNACNWLKACFALSNCQNHADMKLRKLDFC